MSDHMRQLQLMLTADTHPEPSEVIALFSAALSRARAEALEEARTTASNTTGGPQAVVAALSALITTPAPATIPEERVREVAEDLLASAEDVASVEPQNPAGLICSAVTEFARRLGVPLDAATEPALDATCARCFASYGTHKKDGRRTAWDGHREAVLCVGFRQ
jgi:hypothetical protein